MLLFKRLSLQLILVSVLLSALKAGNGNYPAGARSSALSNASVTLYDAWGTFNNQAGLAFLKGPTFGFHFENRFLVKEFSMQAGTFALPFKPGTIGVCYRYFGYSKYYESKFGLAYSRKFTKHFSVGIQVDYLQTHLAEGYGNYNAVAAEIGVMAEPVKNLSFGFHLYNPTRVKRNAPFEEEIPTVMRLGFGYHFEGKASLFVETEKDLDQVPIFKGALEVKSFENLFLRGGFSSGYEQYSFGLGYKYRKIIVDLAFSKHYYLGFSPHVSIGYEF
jgi:hypothetical protein